MDRILEIAEKAAYEDMPQLSPGALKLHSTFLPISCFSKNISSVFSSQEGCSAEVTYLVIDTYKKQIEPLDNGQCKKRETYSSVHVHVEPDGSTRVEGPSNASGSLTASCRDFD